MSNLLDKTERHVLRAHTGQAGFFSDVKGENTPIYLPDRAGRKKEVEAYNNLFSEFSLPAYVRALESSVLQLPSVEAQCCIKEIFEYVLSLTNPDKLDSVFSKEQYDMIFELSLNMEELKKFEPLPQELTDALFPVVHTIFFEYGRECRHDFFQFFNKSKDNELLKSINQSFSPISHIFNNLSTEFGGLASQVNSIVENVNTSVTQYNNAVDHRTFDTMRAEFERNMAEVEDKANGLLKDMSENLAYCINNSIDLLEKLQDLNSKCSANLVSSLCSEGLYAGEGKEILVDASLGEEFLLQVNYLSGYVVDLFKSNDTVTAREAMSQMRSDKSGVLPRANKFITDCCEELSVTHPEYAQTISSQISIYNTVQQIFNHSVEECIYLNYLYSKFDSAIKDGGISTLFGQEEFIEMITGMRDSLNRMRTDDHVALPVSLLDSVDQLFRTCKEFADSRQAIENINVLESSVKGETGNHIPGEGDRTELETTLLLTGILSESSADPEDVRNALKLWREKASAMSEEYTNLSGIAKCCASFNDAYEMLKSDTGRVLLNCGTARDLLKSQFDSFRDMYNKLPEVHSSVMQVLLGYGHEETEITANDPIFWNNVGNQINLIYSPLADSASTEEYINRYKALCDFYAQVIRYCSGLSKKVLSVIDINLGGIISGIPEGASPVHSASEIPESVKPGVRNLVSDFNKGRNQIIRDIHCAEEDFELVDETSVYNLALAARENAVHTLSTAFLTPRTEDEFISDGLIFNETVAHTTLAQMDYILQDIVKKSDLVARRSIDAKFREEYWKYARGIINIFAEMYRVNPPQVNMNPASGGIAKNAIYFFNQTGRTGITESYYLMLALSGNLKFMGFEIDNSINPAQVRLAVKRQSHLEAKRR